MESRDIIELLEGGSCIDCAYMSETPIKCKCNDCEYKDAIKEAVKAIKVLDKQKEAAGTEEVRADLVKNMAAYIQQHGIKEAMELVMDAINIVQEAK